MTATHALSSGAYRGASDHDLAVRHVWLGALRHLAQLDGHHLGEAERRQLEEQLACELPGEHLDTLLLPGDEAL